MSRSRLVLPLLAVSFSLLATQARAEGAVLDPGVLEQVKHAVVRIDGAGGTGTGFLFFSTRHVATAFHLVSLGRPPRVTTLDGETLGATVVAWDEERDLALLELEHPLAGAEPLEAGDPDALPIGGRLVVVGNPLVNLLEDMSALEGLLGWSVSAGILSGRSPLLLQTDAAINPGNSGGPVLGPDGRVLGIVSFKALDAQGVSFATRVEHLTALTRTLGTQRPYAGQWRLRMAVNALTYLDDFHAGVGASWRLLGYDRWLIGLDVSVAFGGGPEDPTLYRSSSIWSTLQASVGYRFRLVDYLYLTPTLGIVGGNDDERATRLETRLADPACVPSSTEACALDTVEHTVETGSLFLRPSVGAHLFLGNDQGLDLGYELQLDPRDGHLSHVLSLGFQW